MSLGDEFPDGTGSSPPWGHREVMRSNTDVFDKIV